MLPYEAVSPEAPVQRHMVPRMSARQPKQRSGNDWVYIPASILCDPICFVILSLPLHFRIYMHNKGLCLCYILLHHMHTLPTQASRSLATVWVVLLIWPVYPFKSNPIHYKTLSSKTLLTSILCQDDGNSKQAEKLGSCLPSKVSLSEFSSLCSLQKEGKLLF